MNKFTKNSFFALSIFICSAIIAMEQEPITVQCSMMITELKQPAMMYAMRAFHEAIFEHNKLESNINDPVLVFNIEELSTGTTFNLPIPAKYCNGLSEDSELKLFESNQYGAFKNVKHLENKPLLLDLICMPNPKLPGNSFAYQLKKTKMEFYKNPGTPWVSKNNLEELINAGVITKKTVIRPSDFYVLTCTKKIPIMEEVVEFSHGPNGCPDEETLLKSITQ